MSEIIKSEEGIRPLNVPKSQETDGAVDQESQKIEEDTYITAPLKIIEPFENFEKEAEKEKEKEEEDKEKEKDSPVRTPTKEEIPSEIDLTSSAKTKKSVSFNPNDEKIQKFITGEPIVDQKNPFRNGNVARSGEKKTPPPVPTKRSTLSVRKTVTQQLREREREKERERDKEREQQKNESNTRKSKISRSQSQAADDYVTTEEVLKQSKYVKTYIKNPDAYFVYDPTVLARLKLEELRETSAAGNGKLPKRKQTPKDLKPGKQARHQNQNQNQKNPEVRKPQLTFKKCSKPNYPELANLKIRTGTNSDPESSALFNPAEVTKNARKFDERVKKLQITSDDDLDEIDGPLTKSESSDELAGSSSVPQSPQIKPAMSGAGDLPSPTNTPMPGTFTNTISSDEFQAYLDRKGLALMPRRELFSPTPTIARTSTPMQTAEERRQQVAESLAALRKSSTKKLSVLQRLSNSLFPARRKTQPKSESPMPRVLFHDQEKEDYRRKADVPAEIRRILLERQSPNFRRQNGQLSSPNADLTNEKVTKSGDSTLQRRNGDSTLQRRNGDSTLQRRNGDSTLQRRNGDSTLQRRNGDSTVQRVNGDSNFQPRNGDSTLQRINGDSGFQNRNSDSTYQNRNGDTTYQNRSSDSAFQNSNSEPNFQNRNGDNTLRRSTLERPGVNPRRQWPEAQQVGRINRSTSVDRSQFSHDQPILASPVASSTPVRGQNQWDQLRAIKEVTDRQLYHKLHQQQQLKVVPQPQQNTTAQRPHEDIYSQVVLQPNQQQNFIRNSVQRNTFSGISGRNRPLTVFNGTPQRQMQMPVPMQMQQQPPRSQSVLDNMVPSSGNPGQQTPVVMRHRGQDHGQSRRIGGLLTREEILEKVKEFCRKSVTRAPEPKTPMQPIYKRHLTPPNADVSPVSYASVDDQCARPQVPQRVQSLPIAPGRYVPGGGMAVDGASPIYAHVSKRNSLLSNVSEQYLSSQQLGTLARPVPLNQLVLVDTGEGVQVAQLVDYLPYVRPAQAQAHGQFAMMHDGRATPLILDQSTQQTSQIYWTPQHRQRIAQPVPAPRLIKGPNAGPTSRNSTLSRHLEARMGNASDWELSSEAGEVRRIMEKQL
ncbi:uncharacterized protein LOC108025782 [Drosophila biarmipes]|uniref:uncharacterized protein LOC108025782 n=1 Tax=Drosophila biarmipes TaxID=125945 RepID=UPI0007E672F1|nr:uncharacterized protein LOC108025782 [Drosophila biarmipes]XP_043948840.1 uncharacterized protein LOC108025782 [Drosophila biarmipes]